MKKLLSILVVLLMTVASAWADDSNLLPGKFSVSADKQVQFTKSNLYWDGSAFKFETNQTDYQTTWDANHVSHFLWATTAAASYAKTYSAETCTTSDRFFADGSDADHKLTVEGTSDLYALTSAEWTYLIQTRTNASSLCKYGVTVTNGGTSYANCLIIAPDNYSGTALSAITDWSLSNINSLSLVCLPAAGNRPNYSNNLDEGGDTGLYWSSTPSGNLGAYSLSFSNSKIDQAFANWRLYASSVRLVKTGPATVSFSTQSITMDALAEQEVKINLSKGGKALSSLQMNITLPEGISYVDGSAKLGSMADDAELSFKNYEGTNKYNVQILPKTASGSQKEFGDNADILSFKIKASKALTDQIKLTYIIGSTTTAEKVTMDDVSADITVNKIDPGFKFDKGTKENPVVICMDETQTFSYTTSSTGDVSLFACSPTDATTYITPTLDKDNKTVTVLAIEGAEQEKGLVLMYKQLSDDVYNEGRTAIYLHYEMPNYEKINATKDSITAIGTVYRTLESRKKIEAARAAYDELRQIDKNLVTNYPDLVAAEEAFNSLKTYSRTTATGKFGTVCLPYSFDVEGAKIYSIAEIVDDYMMLQEETSSVAGMPYIFQATADKQVFNCNSDDWAEEPLTNNGLGGVFKNTSVGGYYLLQNVGGTQKFLKATKLIALEGNRCYFRYISNAAKGLSIWLDEATPVNAVVGAQSDELENGSSDAVKCLERGRIIIIKNGKQYNVGGQQVK